MTDQKTLEISDQFEATLTWESEFELLPGRSYLISFGNKEIEGTITKLKNRITKLESKKEAATTLLSGDKGTVNFSLVEPIEIALQSNNTYPSNIKVLDIISKNQLAVGHINHGLRRALNITWQKLDVNKAARASIKNQHPCVLWFTGYSGSGKSTIANLVEKQLFTLGKHSYILDGDNIRHGLNRDLGFTDADRVENIRRIAETAKLMVDAGLIVLTSFISPFESERRAARNLFTKNEFIEVFIDTSLEECEQRDPKGLYKKVRNGTIKNFTGFDSPYEKPKHAELVINTSELNAEQAAEKIVSYLTKSQ